MNRGIQRFSSWPADTGTVPLSGPTMPARVGFDTKERPPARRIVAKSMPNFSLEFTLAGWIETDTCACSGQIY